MYAFSFNLRVDHPQWKDFLSTAQGHELVPLTYEMIRPQLRQIALRCERAKLGLSTPARQFSYTRTVAEDKPQASEPAGR